MSSKLIFSLDAGTSKVVSLVGTFENKINIIGFSSHHYVQNTKNNESMVMSNGVICEVEKVGHRILQCVHEAQLMADCSAGSLIANLSGSNVHNVYRHSRQEMGSHQVNEEVVRYMIDEAKQRDIHPSYEVVDYEVQEYLIDDEYYTKDPLYLNCATINANLNMFLAGKAYLYNLQKAIRYSGYDVAKLVPSAILSAMAVLNDEEKALGCCLIDIGAGTTDVIVYESGFIRYLISIPLGGENITRDIASVLRISRNLAEDLKINNGECIIDNKHHGDSIKIIDHRGEGVMISTKLLNEVITERVKEILQVVKTQLKNENLYDIITSGVIVTGGSASLSNIIHFAGEQFDLPVRIGIPLYSGSYAEVVCNPKFSTSIGALMFAKELFHGDFANLASDSSADGILAKIKNFFKSN